MTTATTWRFRRLAALYPSSWLAEHGEAYVGTMLDVADADGRSGPLAREWLSAGRHAAGVWADELGRRARDEPGLRSYGLVGRAALVSGAALSAAALVFGEWAPPFLFPGRTAGGPAGFGGRTTGIVLYTVWLVALGLVVAGRAGAARRCLAAATALPVLLVAVRAAGGPDRPTAGVLLALTAFAAAATTLPEPSPRARAALAGATAAGCLAGVAWFVAAWAASPYRAYTVPLGFGFYRQSGLPALTVPMFWAAVAAGVVGLFTLPWRPGVLLAAAVVGTPWAWLSFATATHFGANGQVLEGLAALGLLAAPSLLAVPVALAAGRHRRRPRTAAAP